MTSPGFNPFLKAKLVRPTAHVAAPFSAPASGQPSNANSTGAALPMFQMSKEFGQEGFKSSALNFQNFQSDISSVATFDQQTSAGSQGKPFHPVMPANLSKPAEADPGSDGTHEVLPTSGSDVSSVGSAKKVVVLDSGIHGETVSSIIGNRIGKENVIKIDDPLPEAEFTNLNEFVDKGLTMALSDKADDINNVVDQYGSSVGAINVSSGFSKAALVSTLMDMKNADPEAGSNILKDLGLSEDASDDEIVTALVVRIENVSEGSADYADAKDKLQGAVNNAKQNGIAVVTASGNDHELYQSLDASLKKTWGEDINLIDAVPDITTNLYSMAEGVITVGSVDDNGTKSTWDDIAADFSSRSDNVTIATNGVNVAADPSDQTFTQQQDGTGAGENLSGKLEEGFKGVDGTSFSAPQVASVIAKMNPNLSVEQKTDALTSTAVSNGQIGRRVIGNGEMDEDAALRKAESM